MKLEPKASLAGEKMGHSIRYQHKNPRKRQKVPAAVWHPPLPDGTPDMEAFEKSHVFMTKEMKMEVVENGSAT